MRSLAKKLTGFSLWAILGPALVFGQASFEAQVRGIVHDSSGGVVVGAKVTITDADTGISSNTTTNDRGLYIFNGLRPATYTMKAEMSGFRSEEAKNIILGVSQHTNIDFTLQVAGTESSVTIVEVAVTASNSGLDVPSTVCGLIRSAAWTKNAS